MAVPHLDGLGFRLYVAQRAAFYGFTQALRQICLAHGKPYIVTPPQWAVLAVLAHTDGLPAGRIGDILANDAPTISGVLSRLEKSGLIARRHDLLDRRVVNVFLTEEGRAAFAFLPDAAQDWSEQLTMGMPATEQHQLMESLERIIANARRTLPGKEDMDTADSSAASDAERAAAISHGAALSAALSMEKGER